MFPFFGRENKREERRLQTEISRTDKVDEDKYSDTDEHEPFVEPGESQSSKEKL